jgi:hypothetical protein
MILSYNGGQYRDYCLLGSDPCTLKEKHLSSSSGICEDGLHNNNNTSQKITVILHLLVSRRPVPWRQVVII